MPPALTYNTATNRITGPGVYGFDNAGNMTQDPLSGTTTYTLNADNRVATAVRNSVTVGTYTYDGEGRRVKRVTSTTTTRYIFDAGGKLAAEYTGATPALDREYVASAVVIPASQPAPGGDANNRTQYLTTDHLGSPRIITNAVGAVYSRRDFLPFGELIDPSIGSRSTVTGYGNGSTDGEKHKFTGKERDTETGNDFFEARYYRDILGRFTSPDPLNGTPNRPQSWNRYAYVLNNPLKLIDPTGMFEESLAGSNRRNVNSFNQDTLGLGNDDFAVVAGYTGGYEYGTLAEASSEFTLEAGVSGEADRHINGQPAGPYGAEIELGPGANLAVSATLAREVENGILKASNTILVDFDSSRVNRYGLDSMSDVQIRMPKVEILGEIKNVSISATTNGSSHSTDSAHYKRRAADIWRINKVTVLELSRTSEGRFLIQTLQEAFGRVSDKYSPVYENFGPAFRWKDLQKGPDLTPAQWQKIGKQHENHLHISVKLFYRPL